MTKNILIIGGNVTLQSAFHNVDYKVSGNLDYSNHITRNLFWTGIHPNVRTDDIKYIKEIIEAFLYD